MKYRKLFTKFWRDSKIRSLDAYGKLLAAYLITNDSCNRIGFYYLDKDQARRETGVPDTVFDRVWDTLFDTLSWVYFVESNTVLVRGFWRYNEVENPKALKGFLSDLEQVPDNAPFNEFLKEKQYLKPELQPVFDDLVYPILYRMGYPIGYPMPYKEQEQEKEQEKEQEAPIPTSQEERDPGPIESEPPPRPPQNEEIESESKENESSPWNSLEGQALARYHATWRRGVDPTWRGWSGFEIKYGPIYQSLLNRKVVTTEQVHRALEYAKDKPFWAGRLTTPEKMLDERNGTSPLADCLAEMGAGRSKSSRATRFDHASYVANNPDPDW